MFLVIEIQTNADGTVGNFVFSFADRKQAESKYHAILSAAAISSVPLHAAVMFDNAGRFIASQYYEHVTGMTGGTEE